jgi:hypothetical protein
MHELSTVMMALTSSFSSLPMMETLQKKVVPHNWPWDSLGRMSLVPSLPMTSTEES